MPDHGRAQQLLEQALRARSLWIERSPAASPRPRAVRATSHERPSLSELARQGSALERVAALLALARSQRCQGSADTDATARAFRFALEDPAVIPVLEQHCRANDDIAGYVANAEAMLAHALPTTETAPLRLSVRDDPVRRAVRSGARDPVSAGRGARRAERRSPARDARRRPGDPRRRERDRRTAPRDRERSDRGDRLPAARGDLRAPGSRARGLAARDRGGAARRRRRSGGSAAV